MSQGPVPARCAALAAPLAACLLLGGCLLPQPDTPPILPGVSSGIGKAAPNVSQPAAGGTEATMRATPAPTGTPLAATGPAASPNAGAIATSPPMAAVPTGAPAADTATARLTGRIEGGTATRVAAVPASGKGAGALVTPEADGSFVLDLPAFGSYVLEVTSEGQVTATEPIEVAPGQPATVVVDLSTKKPVIKK